MQCKGVRESAVFLSLVFLAVFIISGAANAYNCVSGAPPTTETGECYSTYYDYPCCDTCTDCATCSKQGSCTWSPPGSGTSLTSYVYKCTGGCSTGYTCANNACQANDPCVPKPGTCLSGGQCQNSGMRAHTCWRACFAGDVTCDYPLDGPNGDNKLLGTNNGQQYTCCTDCFEDDCDGWKCGTAANGNDLKYWEACILNAGLTACGRVTDAAHPEQDCGTDVVQCKTVDSTATKNYFCKAGACGSEWADDETSCNDNNRWVNNGSAWACCSSLNTGTCQNQSYRDYKCANNNCNSFTVTGNRTIFTQTGNCTQKEDICLNSTRMRNYTGISCGAGACVDAYTDIDCVSCVSQTGNDNCITNTPPVVQPMSYTGTCNNGNTITLQCNATDAQQQSNTLAVRFWAGQCSASDCYNTRAWASSSGIVYYGNVPVPPPASGNIFTGTLTINQPVGSAIAATCQATDNAGASSAFGDAYPLCVIGGCANPPDITNVAPNPNPIRSGAITITFDVSDALSSRDVMITPYGMPAVPADYVSKTGNTYTYAFSVYPTTGDGAAAVRVDVTRQSDSCQSTALTSFIIDTVEPFTAITCDGAACGPGIYRSDSLSAVLGCYDATSGCSITRYSINGGALQEYVDPLSFSSTGEYNITYYSTDDVGNTEDQKTQQIRFESISGCGSTTCTIQEDACTDEYTLRDYTDARCIDGACTDIFTDANCANGCMELPGDDACAASPPPVLTSLRTEGEYDNCARTGTPVTITGYGTDPEGDQIRLRCGSVRGLADICTGELASADPSCTFNAAWNDSGINNIFCFLEDTTNTRSKYMLTSVITDNDNPTVFVDTFPDGNSFIPGTVINITAIGNDNGCGVSDIDIYVDGMLLEQCNHTWCNYTSTPPFGLHAFNVTVADNLGNSDYSDGIFKVNNRPNVTSPMSYSGQCMTGSTIEVRCSVTDKDESGDMLRAFAWAGQCESDNCFETRSWATGSGTTYLQNDLMTIFGSSPAGVPQPFTSTIQITQPSGTAIAATCRGQDSLDDYNEIEFEGDMYPLCIVSGCLDRPVITIESIQPGETRLDDIEIRFSVSRDLADNPVVTVIPGYEQSSIQYNATYLSSDSNTYVYNFSVLEGYAEGQALVIIHVAGAGDNCPSEEISSFTIDQSPPITSVLCNGVPCAWNRRAYRTPLVVSFDCNDAYTSCSEVKYGINMDPYYDFVPGEPAVISENGIYQITYRSVDAVGNIENGQRMIKVYTGTCVNMTISNETVCVALGEEEAAVTIELDKTAVHSGDIIHGKIYCFLRDNSAKELKTRECDVSPDGLSIIVDPGTDNAVDYFGKLMENYGNDSIAATGDGNEGNGNNGGFSNSNNPPTTPETFLERNRIMPEMPVSLSLNGYDYTLNNYWTIDIPTSIFHSVICINMTDNLSGLGGMSCGSYGASDMTISPVVTFPAVERGMVPKTTDGSDAPNFTKLMPAMFEVRPYITPPIGQPSLCTGSDCRVEYAITDRGALPEEIITDKTLDWNNFANAYIPRTGDVMTNAMGCNDFRKVFVRVFKMTGGDVGLTDYNNTAEFFINCDPKITIDPVEVRYAVGELVNGKVFEITLWNPLENSLTYDIEAMVPEAQDYLLSWIRFDCNGVADCTVIDQSHATISASGLASKTIEVRMDRAAKSGAFQITFLGRNEQTVQSVIGNILIFSEGLTEFASWQLLVLLGAAVYLLFFSGLRI